MRCRAAGQRHLDLVQGDEAVVVDPTVNPVLDWLEQRQLQLVAVLQTITMTHRWHPTC